MRTKAGFFFAACKYSSPAFKYSASLFNFPALAANASTDGCGMRTNTAGSSFGSISVNTPMGLEPSRFSAGIAAFSRYMSSNPWSAPAFNR